MTTPREAVGSEAVGRGGSEAGTQASRQAGSGTKEKTEPQHGGEEKQGLDKE